MFSAVIIEGRSEYSVRAESDSGEESAWKANVSSQSHWEWQS